MSVVVCCSNDFDVAKAVASIDADVELIGSLTPNELIESYFRMMGAAVAVTPRGNHAVTTNAGMEIASHEKIFVVDSDCVLEPGAVAAVEAALDKHLVVNLPIRFAHDGSRVSRAIAACRNFDNTYSRAAYKPGIAFRAELRDKLGGYWYDERIAWPCDSELLWRLRNLDIAIHHLEGRAIVHRPISLRHACRAYFSYGRDGWKRVTVLHQTTHLVPLSNFGRKLSALFKRARTEPGVLLNLVFDALYIGGLLYQAAASAGRHAPAVPAGVES
jgi:glycosyltransferase involved in cell wall biosynthesis